MTPRPGFPGALVLLAACGGSTAPAAGPVSSAPKAAVGAFPFEPGATIGYRLEDAEGKPIGRAHSTFTQPEEGRWQVVTRVERTIDGSPVAIEHASTFRKDLSPVRYKRLSSLHGRYELEFGDDTVTVVSEPDAKVITKKSIKVPVMPADDQMMLAIAIADLRLGAGQGGVLDAFAPEDLSKEAWKVALAADGTTIDLPGGKAFIGKDGSIERSEIGGRRWVRLPDAGKPPEVKYSPPLSYKRARGRFKDENLRINVTGGILTGELSIPDDRAVWPKGTAPVVLMLSDKGDHNSIGIGGGVDYGYLELADVLADRGFAVARIDDRGVGNSTSEIAASDRTLGLAIGDVLAVVADLAKKPGVDPEHIFLLGHGTGGVVALHAAARAPIAGLLLVATPYRNIRDLLAAEEMRLASIDKLEADRRARLLLSAMAGDPAATAAIDHDRLRGVRSERAFFLDLAKVDMGPVIAEVKVPVALFQGLKDFEVGWREDAEPLLKALEKSVGKGKVKLHAYDHTDHLMKTEPRASSLEHYADLSRRLEQRYITDVVAWLTASSK